MEPLIQPHSHLCTKKVKDTTLASIGIVEYYICSKPAVVSVSGGMWCKGHLKAHTNKQTLWGLRKNYKPATEEDLIKGRSIKLASECTHNLYMYIKGSIYKWSKVTNSYTIKTEIEPNHKLFYIKSWGSQPTI